MTRTCQQCGKEFTLTDSEMEFYKEKGLQLPKRCKACRAANKADGQKPQTSASAAGGKKSKRTPKSIVAIVALAIVALFFGDGLLPEGGGASDPTPPYQSSVVDESPDPASTGAVGQVLSFRNDDLLEQHYEKHGIEMGFSSAEDYERAASDVANSKSALHKTEEEDGDDVYYIEDTNEFVVVSSDGYLRTYFYPSAGLDYFNRQ